MGNREMRKHLAALSFNEKVGILEKLRDRSMALSAARPRDHAADGPRRFCRCSDWEPCSCSHRPPYHCMWCSRELTEEQVSAKKRGFYSAEKREI